ncbi:MAG: 50S ribosome-binding GTPase, partial [Planctomycetes bacterium]|nr:50S ribosome-binding GTPase [Planctomycetota bacterium]
MIRLAGPESGQMIQQVFRPPDLTSWVERTDGAHLHFGQVADSGGVIDDVLVSRFDGMGGPAFDISAHGGVRVVERILQALERAGARIGDSVPQNSSAWPADSLVEAEAIDVLRMAKTERAVRFLAWQRRRLGPWLDHVASECLTDPGAAQDHLTAMIDRAKTAQDLIEGVTVALLGPPNSGKSTLFNRLAGRGAAVVSPTEGTTLDWVSVPVEIDGLPVTLVDTAGTDDNPAEPERQVAAAQRQSGTSSLVWVVVFDESQRPTTLGG